MPKKKPSQQPIEIKGSRLKQIDILIPSATNARTHSKKQVTKIANNIEFIGWTNPVLVWRDDDFDEGKFLIIAGHGRIAAAKQLGMTEVPCIDLTGLSEDEARATVIADNQLAIEAGWHREMLQSELRSLKELGFPIEIIGFDQDELDELLKEDIVLGGLTEDDESIADAPTRCKPGDLWILGDHRLLCGDSTNPLDVSKLCQELEPNLMVTDPPYGVNYDPKWREGADLGVGKRSTGKVLNDDRANWSEAYSLFTGSVAYIWHGGLHTHTVAQNIIDCGFNLVTQIIWVKQHFVLSRGDYHWQHEPCWYAVRKGSKHFYNGARDQASTWDIKNNNSFGNADKEETLGHGTQKPIECMLRPIMNNSKKGSYVYDPFGGSGTTLIAAEKTSRKCLMMELSPTYCDVILKRWEDFTGKLAVLEEQGGES